MAIRRWCRFNSINESTGHCGSNIALENKGMSSIAPFTVDSVVCLKSVSTCATLIGDNAGLFGLFGVFWRSISPMHTNYDYVSHSQIANMSLRCI
ncbi:hypothetical protein V6Z11_D07G160200 [Gossypium hirsutum]